jgi:hypothetical protein
MGWECINGLRSGHPFSSKENPGLLIFTPESLGRFVSSPTRLFKARTCGLHARAAGLAAFTHNHPPEDSEATASYAPMRVGPAALKGG